MNRIPSLSRRNGARLAAVTGSLALTAALTGCGLGGNFASTSTGATAQTGAISGSVHGGQQPVTGATIQLYAAGIPGTGSGYGVGATPLLTSTVTTDANGAFSISGKYTCPTPAQQVYIVATGGNPGISGTVNNTGLAEMAALGTCPAGGTLLATNPFIQITEVTTVAAVTALQQFMAAPATANKFAPNLGAPTTAYATGTTVGSVQSAVVGLNNAFITARVLADPATGVSPNLNYPYATPETAKINTIADILAYCINSDPSSSTNCSSLFAAATPTGKTAAADTIQAAWYMAQNPINNIVNLYNLIPASPAYLPTQLAPMTLNTGGTAPATNAFNDTTIAINYAPTGTSSVPAASASYGVAIDAFGNAWLSNTGGLGGTAASVAELGVDGSAIVSPSGTATTFTANATTGSEPQFTTQPTTNTRSINTPKAIAVDLSNRAWVANFGDVPVVGTANGAAINAGTVGVFNGSTASGVAGAGGGTGNTGFYVGYQPWGVTGDGAGNMYVVNTGTLTTASNLDGRSVAKLVSSPTSSADGTYSYSTSGSTTAPNNTPGGQSLLAVDNNSIVNGGILWSLNFNACKVQGQYNATTPFGTINLYDTSLNSLGQSEIVSSFSNQAPGPPAATTCGSASVGVGQNISAATANPYGIAIDRNNGAWVVDVLTSSLGFDGLTYISAPNTAAGAVPSSFYLVNGTSPIGQAPQAGTTLTKAGMDAVDGNNNVWVVNQTAKSIVEATFTGTAINLLTPGQGAAYGSTGAGTGIGFLHNTSTGIGIAIDPSGNVWVTNNSTSATSTYTNQAGGATPTGNSVTVIVGAAGPVVTPLALAVKASKLGSKP